MTNTYVHWLYIHWARIVEFKFLVLVQSHVYICPILHDHWTSRYDEEIVAVQLRMLAIAEREFDFYNFVCFVTSYELDFHCICGFIVVACYIFNHYELHF
jgi:hypothetical protein